MACLVDLVAIVKVTGTVVNCVFLQVASVAAIKNQIASTQK
jgi:hypothetical protein